MKINIGNTDKLIRLILSIILIGLFYTNFMPEIAGLSCLFAAMELTITSLLAYSPFYSLFNIDTHKKEQA